MYFEEIETIEYHGKVETYDLKVPDYHNFVLANGIVTHNSGKSTLAMTVAHYCDSSFSLKNIVFSTMDLIHAIDAAKPGTAIVFDEAVIGMASGDASTQLQKTLLKKIVTIRKKRLIIFLVIPSIFLLRKYFAILRSKLLIHTYCYDGITRGTFKFYSYKSKRQLYIRGIKEMDQVAKKEDFRGNFTDTSGFYFDMEAYEAKKDEAIKKLTSDDNNPVQKIRADMNEKLEDTKAKYKESISKFKEKIKQIQSEVKDNFKDMKAVSKQREDQIKVDAKAQSKKKISELEALYSKLLATTYEYMKQQREAAQGEDFTISMFATHLGKSKVDRITQKKLNEKIAAGKFQKEFFI